MTRTCPKCTDLFCDNTVGISRSSSRSYDENEDPASYFFQHSLCVICKDVFSTKEYRVRSAVFEEDSCMSEKSDVLTSSDTSSRSSPQYQYTPAKAAAVSPNCLECTARHHASNYVDATTQTYIVNRPELISMAEAAFSMHIGRTNVISKTEPADRVKPHEEIKDDIPSTSVTPEHTSEHSMTGCNNKSLVAAHTSGPLTSSSCSYEPVQSSKVHVVLAESLDPLDSETDRAAPAPASARILKAGSAPMTRFKQVIKPEPISPSKIVPPSRAPPLKSKTSLETLNAGHQRLQSSTKVPTAISKEETTLQQTQSHPVSSSTQSTLEPPQLETKGTPETTSPILSTAGSPQRSAAAKTLSSQPVPSASAESAHKHLPTVQSAKEAVKAQKAPAATCNQHTPAPKPTTISSHPASTGNAQTGSALASSNAQTGSAIVAPTSTKAASTPAKAPIQTATKPSTPATQLTPNIEAATSVNAASAPTVQHVPTPISTPKPAAAVKFLVTPTGVPCWGCDFTFSKHSGMIQHLESGSCQSGYDEDDLDDQLYEVQDERGCDEPDYIECQNCDCEFPRISSFLSHLESTGCGIDGGRWFL